MSETSDLSGIDLPQRRQRYDVDESKLQGMTIFWLVVVVVLLLVLVAVVIIAIVSYDKNKKNKQHHKKGPSPNSNNQQNAAMMAQQRNHNQRKGNQHQKRGGSSVPNRYEDDDHRKRRNNYMQATAMGGAPGMKKGGGRLPMMARGNADHAQMSAVSDLSEEELKDILQPGKPICCLMFYSPGCPACVKTKPMFEQAASMRPAVSFHMINCNNMSEGMMRAFDVQRIPKIVRAHPSQASYVDYKGDRTPDDIVKFAQQSQGIGEMKKYI